MCVLCMICLIYAEDERDAPVKLLAKGRNLCVPGKQIVCMANQADPQTYTGRKLLEFMMWSSEDTVRKTFTQMSLRAKANFLKSMTIKEYDWFLLAFTEIQWQQMWQQLSKEQKAIIPATKKEQLKMMRDSWYELGAVTSWFSHKDPEGNDLFEWRMRAMGRCARDYLVKKLFPFNVVMLPFKNSLEEGLAKQTKLIDNIFHMKVLCLLKEL